MRPLARVGVPVVLCLIAFAGIRPLVGAQAPEPTEDGPRRAEQVQPPAAMTLYLPYLANGWNGVTAEPSPAATPTVPPLPSATSVRTRFPPPRWTAAPLPTDTATPTFIPPQSTTTPTPWPSPTTTASSTATPGFILTATPLPGDVLTLEAVADTFVTEGRPTTAWGGFPGMFIGYDWQAWLRQRPLMRFDLSPLPTDALVLSASLEVYIHNCFECYRVEVTTYRVTQAWGEETATWETMGESFGEAYGRGILDPREGRHWEAFDMTDLVRLWVSGSANNGVMLRGGEDPVTQDPLRYDFWGIEAREGRQFTPRLVIRWLPQ